MANISQEKPRRWQAELNLAIIIVMVLAAFTTLLFHLSELVFQGCTGFAVGYAISMFINGAPSRRRRAGPR